MLRVNGVEVEISGNDMMVEGKGHVAGGGLVATHMDHRIAMSALVMGLASDKPVSLNVRLAAGTAAPTGIQFDLEYDAALEIGVEAGPAAGAAGKSLQSAVIQGGKQRVLVVGFNKSAISDGVVAVLHVSLKGQGEPGKVFPIRITATSGTNQAAESVAITGSDGSVKIEPRRNLL